MKKILTILLISGVITACGGGSDGKKASTEPPTVEPPITQPEPPVNETREEMIERVLELPPEPENPHETVLGVDVNGNNIRDDIERKIALDWYNNPSKMKREMRYAEIWTETFLANGDQDKLIALELEKRKSIACDTVDIKTEQELMDLYRSETDYDILLNNIADRWTEYARASKLNTYVLEPSEQDVREYCSQFDNN